MLKPPMLRLMSASKKFVGGDVMTTALNDVRLEIEEGLQARPNHRVVVDEEHANLGGFFHEVSCGRAAGVCERRWG